MTRHKRNVHQRTLLCITTLTKILCTIMSTFFCFTRIVNLPLLAISIYLSNRICRAGATVDLVLSDPLLSLVEHIVVFCRTHCCLMSNSSLPFIYRIVVTQPDLTDCCTCRRTDGLLPKAPAARPEILRVLELARLLPRL